MRTKKRTTVYHCRLDAERIKEMEKMNQKEVNEIMETEAVELTLTKEQLNRSCNQWRNGRSGSSKSYHVNL